MSQKVFWSWQSDLPARETRDLIRDALDAAIESIAATVEEADRPEIDHDTKGVPGIPEIAKTILAKIEAASVFVADVTPIAVSPRGKHVANPNVLIELGYAKSALTPDRMILVWNTALQNSVPEDLPFDLRHRRGPIGFDLLVDADRIELRKVRSKLQKQLTSALSDILSVEPVGQKSEAEWQESEKGTPGVWKGNSDGVVVQTDLNGKVGITLGGSSFAYARLLPNKWSVSDDALKILDGGSKAIPPLGRWQSLNWGPAKLGFLCYRQGAKTQDDGKTTTATRWFRNTGELWGADSSFLRGAGDTPTYSELAAAKAWLNWVQKSVRTSRLLGGKGPYRVRLGIDRLADSEWAASSAFSRGKTAMEDDVLYEFEVDHDERDQIKPHIRATMNVIRDAFGQPRLSALDFDNRIWKFLPKDN